MKREEIGATSKRRRLNRVSDSFTAKELRVSEILLDLRNLIECSQRKPELVWGKKKKRSLSGVPKEEDIEAGIPKVVSPDTPFSFPPSESDGKSPVKRRSRDEYGDMIEGLTRRRDLLLGEIDNVKQYYERLEAFNSQLQACKSEMVNKTAAAATFLDHRTHPQPSIGYPTVVDYQRRMGQTSDDGPGPEPVNDRGALLIDLNVPCEEEQRMVQVQLQPRSLDLGRVIERARFAEARRHRRGIMKRKWAKCSAIKLK